MSVAEVVGTAIAAAHSSQGTLNAFTFIDDELAMERAAAIDARGDTGGLTGVPIGLKDLIEHEGRVNTCGSAFYRELADTSAPCVRRLEDAGAVIIGRTGLHEWAFGFSSENPHWGPVRNPWDTSTSPGGSSGGSATAVAAGIVPIAIGTDTGGSVRVPAGLCGIYGLKVSHGRIPLDGVFPLVPSIDTVGPLANSVSNLDLSYRAMAADTALEPAPREWRFGVPQPWCESAPCSEQVASAFEALVGRLRLLGHEVNQIDLPDVVPSHHIWSAIAEEAREVHRPFRERGESYGPDVKKRLDDADVVTDAEIAAARAWQSTIRTRFEDAFNTVDFLITPTVATTRKVIGEDMIGDLHYRTVISYFSSVVNQSLHPAIAMPLTDTGSPPVSLQAIGDMYSELELIALGRSLEKAGVVAFEAAPSYSAISEDG